MLSENLKILKNDIGTVYKVSENIYVYYDGTDIMFQIGQKGEDEKEMRWGDWITPKDNNDIKFLLTTKERITKV